METQLPLTPYAGTSGWSGSDTSAERARTADKDGTTAARQRMVLEYMKPPIGVFGVTWKELAAEFGWHHGQASGVLSVLHKEGLIARLSHTRSRCKVYVLPQYTQNRSTEPYQPNRRRQTPCPNCGHEF